MRKTAYIPDQGELDEPNRRIDALIDYIMEQEDSDDLIRLALESISTAGGLTVQVGSHDPVKQFRQFAESAIETFLSTGEWHPELRLSLVKAAADHCREIARIGKEWTAARDDLERQWFGGEGDGRLKVAYLGRTPWPLLDMPSQ